MSTTTLVFLCVYFACGIGSYLMFNIMGSKPKEAVIQALCWPVVWFMLGMLVVIDAVEEKFDKPPHTKRRKK